jgi:hypothetical protein
MRLVIQDIAAAVGAALLYLVAGEYMPVSNMLIVFCFGYLFVDRGEHEEQL